MDYRKMSTAIIYARFVMKGQALAWSRWARVSASSVEAAVSAATISISQATRPPLQSPRLLAQQMMRVSNQFRYRLGLRRVVIAADLTMSIHEDHSCAVHRKSLRIASV